MHRQEMRHAQVAARRNAPTACAAMEAAVAATGHGYLTFARTDPAHFRLMFRTELIDTANQAWRQAATADERVPAVSPGAPVYTASAPWRRICRATCSGRRRWRTT
jgi:hypothetical protein